MNEALDPLNEIFIEVTEHMLPLSCPLPSEELWNKHPRVFLPVEQEGHVQCPYCGNKFMYKHQSHRPLSKE